MLPFTINVAPLILSLFTSFGILFHDTHMGQAFMNTTVSGYVSEPMLRGEQHTHTETMAENLGRISSTQPRLQTRFTDEKKYISPKKVFLNTTFDGLS